MARIAGTAGFNDFDNNLDYELDTDRSIPLLRLGSR